MSEKYVFVILVTWSFKWCSYVIWVLHVVSIKPHQISSAPGFWLVFSRFMCSAAVRWPDGPPPARLRRQNLWCDTCHFLQIKTTLLMEVTSDRFSCARGEALFFLTCLLMKCDFWSSPRFTRVRISTRPFPPSGIAPGIESKSHFLSHTGSDL